MASTNFTPGTVIESTWLNDVDDITYRKSAEILSLMDPQYGAVGDGITDDSSAIEAWLDDVILTGKRGYVPNGTYYMETALTINVTNSIDIEAADNAIFVGGASINQIMILFLAATREEYSITWKGGTIDNSNTVYVVSDLSGGGLGIQKVWKCVIDGVKFEGPTDYSAGGGDSGLTIVDCRFVSVTNCVFSGQRDLGIYITGDSAIAIEGDGGDIVITGNHFIKCAAGIGVKRQTQRVTISSNTFYYCFRGVTIVATNVVTPDPPAGRRCSITDNSFAFVGRNAIQIQTGGATIIAGNRIQDFGFSLDGVTPVSNPTAIILEGVSNNVINCNWIGMQEWTRGGSHAAVVSQQFTYDGSPLLCTFNTFSDNYIFGLDIGFRETSAQAENNRYYDNSFVNTTTDYSNIQTSSISYEYSQGTWTVTLYDAASLGNASPTTATGYYTKIGRVVNASFSLNNIVTTGMTGGNILYITLPFSANNDFGAVGTILLDSFTFPTSVTQAVLAVGANSSRATISGLRSTLTDSAFTVASISSGTSDIVQATITYTV